MEEKKTDRNPDEGLVRLLSSGLRECVFVHVCVSVFHIVA